MIFICSRGRKHRLQEFFRVSKPTLPGRILIDDDDDSYAEFELPQGWEFIVGKRGPTTRILNSAFRMYPCEDYYGVVCDDMVYTTPNWDVVLSTECLPHFVSWGNDGRSGKNLCTSFFIGGDLVRKFGWLVYPEFGHLYGDTVWWMIARGSGLAKYRGDVKFTHTKVLDKTYVERSIAGDASKFEHIRGTIVPILIKQASELTKDIKHQDANMRPSIVTARE